MTRRPYRPSPIFATGLIPAIGSTCGCRKSAGRHRWCCRFTAAAFGPATRATSDEFFLPFYGITKDEIDTPKAYALYAAAAPITYLTKDDPPVLLKYSYANEPITARSSVGLMVHHPLLGIALKREMDRLGIECVVQHLRAPNEELTQDPAPAKGGPISMFDFIHKHFAGFQQSADRTRR